MARIVEFPVQADGVLRVQAAAADLALVPASPGKTVEHARETLEDALASVTPALGVITDRLRKLSPDEVTEAGRLPERILRPGRGRDPCAGAWRDRHRTSGRRLPAGHGLAEGGRVEQWPVGVIDGPATEEAVSDFAARVHRQFAAEDPAAQSELVYRMPTALAEFALRNGVLLRSLIEYQGLIDLRPLAEAQRERLAGDRIYPARLHIDQRYRIVSGGGHRPDLGPRHRLNPRDFRRTVRRRVRDRAR
jgi:NACHT-associated inactive restriction endonuclease